MSGTPPRLLLVDDELGVRLTLSALFEDEGWHVAEASSLAEARRALATSDDTRVVVLDANLPDGYGPTLVPEIRAALPRAAIVLLSGNALTPFADVECTLPKAGSPTELLHAIDEAVRLRAVR